MSKIDTSEWPAIAAKRGGTLWAWAPKSQRKLHLNACYLLGYAEPLPFTAATQQLWCEFERCEYGATELRDVIRWREKQRTSGKTSYGTGLSALIADMGKFAEQLAQARRKQGPPRKDVEEIIQRLPEGGERRVEIPATTPDPAAIDDAAIAAALAPIKAWRASQRRN